MANTKIVCIMLQRIGHRNLLVDENVPIDESTNPRALQHNMVFYRYVGEKIVDGTKTDFNFKNTNHTIDLTQIDYVDKKGRPLFKYDIEISPPLPSNTPIHMLEEIHAFQKVIDPKNPDKVTYKPVIFKLPSSRAQHWLFIRRTMAAILSSATKLQAETPIWLLLGAGVAIGMMIMALIYPHVFPPTVITQASTSVTSSITSSLGIPPAVVPPA